MSRVRAPELPSHLPWLNGGPLRLKDLRGRIVLLDFWTYCCINCLHMLPHLKFLEQKYREHLSVVGIHAAKFDNEKASESLQQAILRYGIEHPVLIDNELQMWDQYAVKAWPTLIIIDPAGYVIRQITGERDREILDQIIGDLLQPQPSPPSPVGNPVLRAQPPSLDSPLAFPGKVLAGGDRLFIADSGHHRIVVASLSGEILSIIGSGQAGLQDGSFREAQFSNPQGMALDPHQSFLYVADTGNHALRCIDLRHQRVTTLAGTGQQSSTLRPQQGLALETALNSPWDLALADRQLWIAMAGSHQIWQMNLDSNQIQTYAGTGAEFGVDGPVQQAAFAQPSGLATDRQTLWVADSEISSIRAISLSANPQVQTVCGSGELFDFGDIDAQGRAVRLQHCLGIAYDSQQLWVADTYNHKIKQVNPRTGTCTTLVGNGTAGLEDGQGTESRFAEPSGLSVSGDYLYVADTNNHTIRQVHLTTATVTTISLPELCASGVCVPDLGIIRQNS